MISHQNLYAATFLTLGALTSVHAAPPYDAAADFSSVINPAGEDDAWTYGYEVGGVFTKYTLAGAIDNPLGGVDLPAWGKDASFTPGVFVNPSETDLTFVATTFRAHQLNLHPGPFGEYSVVRFTAPAFGQYDLTSSFNMRSGGGSAFTSVHVRFNGNNLFDSAVLGFNAQQDYNNTLLMMAGEYLDFIVGPNGNYGGDTTELRALLVPVPEPENLALMLAGLAVIGAVTFRRRLV